MKHFSRRLLFVFALAAGGGSGYLLLPGFDPVKIMIFAVICLIFGQILYQIDQSSKVSKT